MSEVAPASRTTTILVYSDDLNTRGEVRLALGRRIAADLPEIEIVECATHQAVSKALDHGGIDLVIMDGEAVPAGGIGLARQVKDEIANCPPIVLLVARVADAWLATWSGAEAVVPYPVDAVRLPSSVADVLRSRVTGGANAR